MIKYKQMALPIKKHNISQKGGIKMNEKKKFRWLSVTALAVSIFAAVCVITLLVLLLMKIGPTAQYTGISACLLLLVSIVSLAKAIVVDKQRSLIIIWSVAALVFIAGVVLAFLR
jgi:hypothetical protein